MTKISQLSDIGGALAADDEFVIRDVSDGSTPNKKVTASGLFNVATALGFTGLDSIVSGPAGEAKVQIVASGLNGRSDTTISGVISARTTISGYLEAPGPAPSLYYPIVSQNDVGSGPNQVPLNSMLGDMAFANYPFLRGGSNTTTTSGTLTVNASLFERFNYTASMTTGITVQFSNVSIGREVKMYIRNTNATARLVTFEASASGTGYSSINLSLGSPPGGASASSLTLSGSTGTAMVWVGNINGTLVGGLV